MGQSKTRIIFRADGNSQIGLGHVVRSLALAQMLRDDFECVFAIQAPSYELQEQIKQSCDGIIVLPACAPEEERFLHELDAYIAGDVIVVLDGYHFNTAYQRNIKGKGCPLACIDDLHAFPLVADVVLNQAGGVGAGSYDVAPYTKLLLGPAYALLRPPFLVAAKAERSFPAGQVRVFLNLGGSDPQNHTLRITRELERLDGIGKVEVTVGSAYQHLRELESWMEKNPKYRLHQNLEAEELCRLMRSCAVAVTSASGVSYEYASVGGLLYVLQTADNQADLFRFLTKEGIALPFQFFGPSILENVEAAFQEKVKTQRRFFDGRSGERLLGVFHTLGLMAGVTLREVTAGDEQLLLDWANDPEVRRNSFNPNPILPENHTRWLKAKLEDERAKLYIAEAAGTPAAHIRFEVEKGTATLSYLVAPGFRGRGLGYIILLKGIDKFLKQNSEVKLLLALVKKENVASTRALEKAGFNYAVSDQENPQTHRFELRPGTYRYLHSTDNSK